MYKFTEVVWQYTQALHMFDQDLILVSRGHVGNDVPPLDEKVLSIKRCGKGENLTPAEDYVTKGMRIE